MSTLSLTCALLTEGYLGSSSNHLMLLLRHSFSQKCKLTKMQELGDFGETKLINIVNIILIENTYNSFYISISAKLIML